MPRVDIDTVNDDFAQWAQYYLEHGGSQSQLTVSSDAHTPGGALEKLQTSFVSAVRSLGLSPRAVLPFFTRNPAQKRDFHSVASLTPEFTSFQVYAKPPATP